MKNITTITSAALLIAATNLSAQVGINTDTPKSTLDVVGKATDTSSLDGITAPRLTGDQLRAKTYTSAQTGTLVYVTVADTAPAGQTVNVTAVGYFYFDGTVWQKVNTGTNASVNIYNADGSLTGNRTLTLNNKSLNFIGTDRSTYWDPEGRIHQRATNTAIDAAMGLHNGNANLWLQQWNSYSAITASDGSTSLSLATHYTNVSAPITLSTSPGNNTTSVERMRITGEGNVGVMTTDPTERFDNAGITRLRNLPTNGATNAINTTSTGDMSAAQDQTFTATRTVVADDNGVLGTVVGLPAVPVNIYNANGTLTSNRTLTQASRTLTFLGTNQSTTFYPNNGLSQTGIAGSKRASIALSSNDNNSDGASSNLQLFQDPEQMSQIIAGNDSRGLSIGTSFTTQPTPITFITATGNTSGIERARITPTGNFGVNTQGFASEKFDVNGIARIRTLPLNGTTNAINTTSSGTASASQDQTFSATRTVVADANGVLGTVNYIPPVPVVLAGADGSDATGTGSFTLESKNDVLTEATLTQRTFSVTKKSLVTFSYSVGIGHIEKFGGGNLTDGLSKQIGSRLVFSAVPSGSPYTVGNTLIRSAMPFSTAGAPSIAGYFYLNGTEMLILDPGSYTVDLRGYVSATDNNQGIRALLDGASDRLNIVAIPMQ